MKKNLLFYLVLLAIPLVSFMLLSYSNGAPSTGGTGFTAGVTGSPGDGGATCVVCHGNTGSFGTSISITTDIGAGGFNLSQTYHITVAQTSTGSTDYGFQITAEDPTNTKVGTFLLTDAINTNVDGAGHYVTQSFAGKSIKTWSFDWKAPKAFTGNVTFYAATLASGVVSGNVESQTITSSYSVGGVLAVNNNQFLDFNMYPNPSDGFVNFQLPSNINHAKVDIFDYLGKKIMQKEITTTDNTLNVSKLSTGIYFVRIQSNSKIGTRKLVVK